MDEHVSRTPWPTTEPVVFLGDTKSQLERSLLEEWLRDTDPRTGGGAPTELVDVVLEDDKRSDSAALRQALQRPGSTTLVPLRVAWLPDLANRRPGPRVRDLLVGGTRRPRARVAKWIQHQSPDRARCIAGAPAKLDQLRERYDRTSADSVAAEDFASFVQRQAGIALDVEERRLQGRRYKVPLFVIRGMEGSASYQTAVAQLAERVGRTPKEVGSEARRYLEEMVAKPNTFFIDWMGTLTRWITALGYQEIVTDPDNIKQARDLMGDQPSALLWTHKSHVDAIALLSVMYEKDFPAPHSVGGLNMAFAGVGYAGRRAGTVFIRRAFSDNPAYKLALRQYIGYLLGKRFPLSWALEGTRSRNGKLGPPRYGLLKYVIDAAHATGTENLQLIPVSINYDLIGETAEYAREESGQPKEAESLGWFMDYLRRLKAPMGNIYLDFAEPVVLKGKAPEATKELLSQVAFEVARRANERVPVTLSSLMCLALLGAAPRALTYAELETGIARLLKWLRRHDIRLARSLARMDIPELETLAENVFQGGVVRRITDGSETLFEVDPDQYPVASFYRNTIIHYFVDKAIAEIALLRVSDQPPQERSANFWSEARWLRDLTKFEFFQTPSADFASSIDAHLSFYEPAWEEVLEGSRGDLIALLGRLTPLISHATLLPYLEAYWTLTKVVADTAPGEEISESEAVAKALRLGKSALHQRRITSPEAIGKAMFKGAYSYLKDQGLLAIDDDAVPAERIALTTRLEATIREIRQIAELSHADLFARDAAEAAE